MIEKGINSKYFKEARLGPFFEQCFALAEPNKLMAEPRFHEFCYTDLKFIFQIVSRPKNIMEFTKFLLFFKVEDDPEIVELLCD